MNLEQNKAYELVAKFRDFVQIDYTYDEEPIVDLQKQCAKMCVEERLRAQLEIIENIQIYLPAEIYAQAIISCKSTAEKTNQEISNIDY